MATVAEAEREPAWEALLDVDLLKLGREAPMVGMLGALRMLPEIVGHLLDIMAALRNLVITALRLA